MKQQRVAIQGQAGSYHDIARRQYFKNATQLVCQDTFKEVFAALSSGQANYAVSAIENSLYGSINEVYDLLLKNKFWICGEIYLRIQHCLLGIQGSALKDINEVYSQGPALAQCEEFLETKLAQVKRIETHDTAASAELVAKWQDPTKAAIASSTAAKLHGLKILESEIETHKQNYTRFIVLEKTRREQTDQTSKTSIVLKLAERPGILHQALGAFAKRNINLSKLESRPIIGKAWHYMFYIDFEAGADSPQGRAALQELVRQGSSVTLLGTYQTSAISG